ncbi:hypothetical protein KAR91_01880 [Candidatus Pacearchaeota archaeon]|nr:hypothetical protein [Candidatus Pacearchaeota archaeon]
MQEIVYKVPGKNAGPYGKSYDWMPVNSEGELSRALKDGWFNTLEDAVNGKVEKRERARNDDGEYVGDDPSAPDVSEAYVDKSAPTRNEMNTKAKGLGIQYAKNISDRKLLKLIAKKLSEG